jgi:hypothetical protein
MTMKMTVDLNRYLLGEIAVVLSLVELEGALVPVREEGFALCWYW